MKRRRTLEEWKKLFDQVNQDCCDDGYDEVPYSNVEFYTQQIMNLEGWLSESQATEIAQQLSNL
jgi:hypothetical protein